jgi:hypothetical protein
MSTAAHHVDFDLHGFVGIRLLEPTARDIAVLTRQLGPSSAPLQGEPDITVRFVDRIPDERPLTYVGWPETGFTDSSCYLLRGREGVAARTLFPFADVGGRCEIVCERAAEFVPHLLAVVNFTALAKGLLPLHASAFSYRGLGVLAAGWAKGGKTETLLAFAGRGARYIGDEWIYLTPDGEMYGVPEPIRLWHWHIEQLPGLRSGLGAAARARLSGIPAVASSAEALARRLPRGGLPASVLRRAAPVLRRQAYLQVPPAELFGEDAIALRGHLDAFLLLAGHDRDSVSVEEVDAGFAGRRMLASLEEERAPFMTAYRQFRFAFPDRHSETVEQAGELERALIEKVLSGRTAHLVRHPYPVRLDSLIAPVESILPRR